MDQFLLELQQVTRNKDESNEYWTQYGSLARTNSMIKDSIQKRHDFFMRKMLANLSPLTRRDPKREFSREERELLYFIKDKKCAICGDIVPWLEAEVHHTTPHTDGGITSLEENADLVHRKCHPRGLGTFGHSQMALESEEIISEEVPWEIDDNGQ